MPLGLYLHIPFCSAICSYCNFNRGLLDEALARRYVSALEREIRAAGGRESTAEGAPHRVARQVDTIYFGGGTPSLLAPSDIARLVAACKEAFDVARDAEITLEANPETVTRRRLAEFREAGVNRLSYGVQSFRDEELRRLSRVHDARRAREAFSDARREGFENVSLDLMMWLPAQALVEWLESVEGLIDLGPEHASLYLLELYPNAPLREEMARASWSQAPDEDAANMYLIAMERLEAAGYRQYEISNVARPGRESRHNLKYWQDGEWLGLGCGAHSTVGGVRWKNVSAAEDYVRRLETGASPIADSRSLTRLEGLEEALFTGLRLAEGVDEGQVGRRYGVDVWARYADRLGVYVEAGLLVRGDGRLRLTRNGMLLANEVMSAFIELGSTVK